jgi:branched-subunit amino acid aminotransferase/4-amino-4-deoxychorismate lyase
MVTEERKQEIQENRRTFQRLNREIVEGKRRKETMTVTGRDGTPYDLEIHALSELAIARAAHVANLSLPDLMKGGQIRKLVREATAAHEKVVIEYGADSQQAKAANQALQDALAKEAAESAMDEKGLAKLQFVDEIASAALVGDTSERLTADELAEILPGTERAKVFTRALEISGLTAKAQGDAEKFRGEPPGQPTSDASV